MSDRPPTHRGFEIAWVVLADPKGNRPLSTLPSAASDGLRFRYDSRWAAPSPQDGASDCRYALRELSSVLNASPQFALAYLLTAETQRRYLDFKGCEMTLRMAEQRFPDHTEVFANRIRCTMLRYGIKAPESLESVAQLKALAAKDPDHPLVQEILLLISE